MTETQTQTLVTTAPTRPRKKLSKANALGVRLLPFLEKYLAGALVPVFKDLRARNKELERETLALKHRLAALETVVSDRSETAKIKNKLAEVEDVLSNAMCFQGAWEADRVYRRGACVSHSGSLWFALTESVDVRPGSGGKTWKMTMKSGVWNDAR
jgi:hypothetical protein